MKLEILKPAVGSVRSNKRLGRGTASGKGGTSTRGHKGDKSRSGFKNKRHFEGGQMPLQMRLPKRGFKNINRVEYVPLNVERLQAIAEKHNVSNLDLDALVKFGIVSKNDKVKVLGGGDLTATLHIKAHAFSESAKKAVEEKGGTLEVIQ